MNNNMQKRINSIAVSLMAVALCWGSISSTVQAQSLKIGYTDHEVIIVNMPDYQQVQEQMRGEYQTSQEELGAMYQDYQDRLERYQKQQALLSEQRRAEREQELTDLQAQIQETAAIKDQELAERETELLQPLLDRVQASIDKVAQEKELDIVLRTQVGAQPIILYVNEETIVDITMDVAIDLGLDVGQDAADESSN